MSNIQVLRAFRDSNALKRMLDHAIENYENATAEDVFAASICLNHERFRKSVTLSQFVDVTNSTIRVRARKSASTATSRKSRDLQNEIHVHYLDLLDFYLKYHVNKVHKSACIIDVRVNQNEKVKLIDLCAAKYAHSIFAAYRSKIATRYAK